MDYLPVNIAPKGVEQGFYYTPTIGTYDHWAIEYGYKPISASSPDAELPELKKIASRSARGTCHVEVLDGMDLFEPPEPPEEDLLNLIGGRGTSRLACQAKLKAGSGLVRLRAHLSRE
jgi:hypothetical protein